MKRKHKILIILLAVSVTISLTTVPAFALTESEVQDQVNAIGKESVTGNLFVWFLCAIAFLKVSQKIDSFMSSLGINYNGEQIVLFVGKLTAFKGADTLLRAAKQYERLEKGKIITLIVGSGDERKKLEALKDSLGLKGVFFLGHREQEELRRLYSTADVLAVPSRKEPFGLVALEAMACGLPVVASNEGGLPEFIKVEN